MNAGFKILADRRILEIHRQVPKSGLCRQWADAPAPKRWEEPMIAESAIGRKKNGVTFTVTPFFCPTTRLIAPYGCQALNLQGFGHTKSR